MALTAGNRAGPLPGAVSSLKATVKQLQLLAVYYNRKSVWRAYVPCWWNPALFAAGGASITLLPVAAWAVAPVALYTAMLALGASVNPSRQAV